MPVVYPFPIRQVPTWAIHNYDDPQSIPLMGQFNVDVIEAGGKPVWSRKASIAGGKQWLQHIGDTISELQFNFHAISNDILDQYPAIAWNRLKELAKRDETLGRPPLVIFVHGSTIIRGYITSFGEPTIKYWEHNNMHTNRLIREIGPVNVVITVIPGEEINISLSTSYVLHQGENTLYEEIAKDKFKNASFGASIREYNQGVTLGGQIEVPRKQNPKMRKRVDVSSYFDTDDVILGL